MTRKDFVAIAKAISGADKDLVISNSDELKEGIVGRLCVIFKAGNPLFQEEKFRKACGTISFDESNQ